MRGPIPGLTHREASVEQVKAALRKYGPYLVIEALMPGGTLVALALYLYRTKRPAARIVAP
jgi:hypothetical protein